MNCLSWLETLPQRVGVPKSTASAQTMSSAVAVGSFFVRSKCWLQAALEAIASSGASSATCRTRTSAPAFSPVQGNSPGRAGPGRGRGRLPGWGDALAAVRSVSSRPAA